jgi:hypothetical protein
MIHARETRTGAARIPTMRAMAAYSDGELEPAPHAWRHQDRGDVAAPQQGAARARPCTCHHAHAPMHRHAPPCTAAPLGSMRRARVRLPQGCRCCCCWLLAPSSCLGSVGQCLAGGCGAGVVDDTRWVGRCCAGGLLCWALLEASGSGSGAVTHDPGAHAHRSRRALLALLLRAAAAAAGGGGGGYGYAAAADARRKVGLGRAVGRAGGRRGEEAVRRAGGAAGSGAAGWGWGWRSVGVW